MPAQVLDTSNTKVKEYLAKIGEVIVTFNFLESQVDFWIQHLLNPNHPHAGYSQMLGKRVTVLLNFSQKAKLLLSLVIERNGNEKGVTFKKIYSRLESAAKNRNDIIHSLWFLEYGNAKEGTPPITQKINAQKSLKFNEEANFELANKTVTPQDLQQNIDEMLQLITDLVLFFSFE